MYTQIPGKWSRISLDPDEHTLGAAGTEVFIIMHPVVSELDNWRY